MPSGIIPGSWVAGSAHSGFFAEAWRNDGTSASYPLKCASTSQSQEQGSPVTAPAYGASPGVEAQTYGYGPAFFGTLPRWGALVEALHPYRAGLDVILPDLSTEPNTIGFEFEGAPQFLDAGRCGDIGRYDLYDSWAAAGGYEAWSAWYADNSWDPATSGSLSFTVINAPSTRGKALSFTIGAPSAIHLIEPHDSDPYDKVYAYDIFVGVSGTGFPNVAGSYTCPMIPTVDVPHYGPVLFPVLKLADTPYPYLELGFLEYDEPWTGTTAFPLRWSGTATSRAYRLLYATPVPSEWYVYRWTIAGGGRGISRGRMSSRDVAFEPV